MIIELSSEMYETLKKLDFSELKGEIVFDDDNNSVSIMNKRLFFVVFSEEITAKGMTKDFLNVNEFGRKLYRIYDTILYMMEEANG